MGAKVIILANPYTYNFIKGLTHSALAPLLSYFLVSMVGWIGPNMDPLFTEIQFSWELNLRSGSYTATERELSM